ncbi:DUF4192 family protein [Brevibacterium oceani]|uniref:DUF4192 family protein n=1 Tax=Brevibacterium oceani TaxID=358099 RepID=UPI001B32CC5D|nr:DUF4192 family protein [Brevibacterium oceani]
METPARTPEDIIGIIPHTLGYIPRDSLVAVIIGTETNGSQSSSTTLRVDFTLETAADILLTGGSGYVDLIGRACAVTGVFLVVYDEGYQPISPLTGSGDQPTIAEAAGSRIVPTPAETAPTADEGAETAPAETTPAETTPADGADCEDAAVHRGLVRAAIDELAQSFASAGIDTLCAWWVSQEQFGRIDDDGDDSTPLIAATTSPCATELIAAGSNPVGTPQELVIAPMTAQAFAHSRRGHTDEWMGTDDAFVILADVYARLDAIRADDEPIDVTHLHAMLDLPTVMAIDALLAEKWSRDALEMILSFDHPDFPPSLVTRLDGEQLCDRSRRFSARSESAQEIVGLSARAPRPRDVMLTIAFLKEYLPMCHPRVRADTYAVIAWFEWALGGSTMADSYARAATDIDPEHGLAKLVVRAVRLGFLPRWLMESEPSSF